MGIKLKGGFFVSRMVVVEQIEQKIYFVRGIKVMLDYDLAPLYGIEVKYLKRAVKRNLSPFFERFYDGIN